MTDPNDSQLMRMHLDACFLQDEHGRLVRANDWTGRSAPRLWLGRTSAGPIWRLRNDVAEPIRSEIEALCSTEPPCAGQPQPPQHDATYRRLLSASQPITEVVSGPTYWTETPSSLSVDTVAVTRDKKSLLQGGLEDWIPDIPHQQPMMATLEGGRAVAVCASVRITVQAHEAGAETLPTFRRKGHATAAVAGWAHAVLQAGVMPLYSTSWDNEASQRVATRAGFAIYGQEYWIS